MTEKKIGKRLKVYVEEHEYLGRGIVMFTPTDTDTGSAAFRWFEDDNKKEIGTGIRLTLETAEKLAFVLNDLVKKAKKK